MRRVTADQVARRAGVSRSAVSRTFTKDASVAPETRAKVMVAARELGYQPNGLASSLAKGNTNIVALITNSLPDLRRPYLTHELNTRLQALRLIPYTICIGPDYNGEETLSQIIQMPLNTAIVGADSVTASQIAPFCIENPPIMLSDLFTEADEVDAVQIDDAQGICEMTRHIVKNGGKTIWLIAPRRTSSSYNSRNMAFLKALAQSELKLIDSEIGDFSYESGKKAFGRLMARGPLPDCLFCANDAMAMGAMDSARFEHDLKVPEALGVFGFDDIPHASWPTYQLSTVRQSVSDTAKAVCDILEERLKGPALLGTISRTVNTQFVKRHSGALKNHRD